MAKRISLSGHNDEALTIPATDCREVISGQDFDGEGVVFRLRGIVIGNEHATEVATVELWDQDEGAATATNQRGVIMCPPVSTTVVEFPVPGLAFKTNITASTTLGTIGAYGVVAMGYKE